MRHELLAAKKEEIQKQLSDWAVETGILGAGERIVFSVCIEQIPVVVAEVSPSDLMEATLNMRVKDFFTRERLLAAGATGNQATRVRNIMTAGWLDELDAPLMRDFVEKCTMQRLSDVQNAGAVVCTIIHQTCAVHGLVLRPQ